MSIDTNLLSCCDFYGIDTLYQSWERLSEYSFMTMPRPEHGFCFVKSGAIIYTDGRETLQAHSGDIVYLKQGSNYKASFVNFGGEYTRDILVNFCIRGELGLSDRLCVLEGNSDKARECFDNLLEASRSGGKNRVKACFYSLLDYIEEQYETYGGDENIFLAKSLIDSFDENGSSDEKIAEMCKISVSTLQRRFKKQFGRTISAYRGEIKISRAKQYLLSGKYTVNEVSDMLGFYDCSYFIKFFCGKTGLTPKQFVRSSSII